MTGTTEAKEIAAELMAELKAGRLNKIGIDEIRKAIRSRRTSFNSQYEAEGFEMLVCRKVVEAVSAKD